MKKIIISAIIITTLAIVYYFVIFLPSQKLAQTEQAKQSFLFDKQTECMNICKNLYKDDIKIFPEGTVFNPRYAYNKKRNACFYSGGRMNTHLKVSSKFVVNCQTNEEVLSFVKINDEVSSDSCDTCASSIDEYREKEEEYMGN